MAAAASAACRRVRLSGINSSIIQARFDSRYISQLSNSNGKRVFLVDTLALVSMEKKKGQMISKFI
jgi:hypothetical protein